MTLEGLEIKTGLYLDGVTGDACEGKTWSDECGDEADTLLVLLQFGSNDDNSPGALDTTSLFSSRGLEKNIVT